MTRRPKIVRGLFYAVLALAQAWFAYVFALIVNTVSQTTWYTIHWRWILPWFAIVSCILFVRSAFRCFRPHGVAAGE